MGRLITTTAELRKIISIDSDFNFEIIAPYIDQAQTKFVIPLISRAQFDSLIATLEGEDELTDIQAEGLQIINTGLANLAFMLYIPIGQVRIDDTGIHIDTSATKKTAFEHQILALQASLTKLGYDALEEALLFMEDNTATFSDWASSTAFTEFKNSIISTAVVFNEYYNIESSRRLFLSLKHVMKKVVDFYIIPFLSKEYYDVLIAEISDDDVSEENQIILDSVRPAFAALTVSLGLIPLALTINERGVIQFDNTGSSSTVNSSKPADQKLFATHEIRMKEDGLTYLKKAVVYLNKNASLDLYTEFFNSEAYVGADATGAAFDNDVNSKFYFL